MGDLLLRPYHHKMDIPMTTQSQTGYTKLWLNDGKILCYRFHDVKHETVDAWSDDLNDELQRWPADKRLRLIYDIRQGGVSRYALNRARKHSNLRPDVSGRTAILVNIGSPLITQLVGVTIRGLSNRYRQRSVFADEQRAVDWLLEQD
jgi:hypothetical protein